MEVKRVDLLTGLSGLHRNSPQGLNISSIRVLTRSEIRKSQSPFAPIIIATVIITKHYFLLCSSVFIIAASGGLIVLRPTRSPEAAAETTHSTLRKWTIKTNLHLNTQGLMDVKNLYVQSQKTNLGPLTSLSGTDRSTLKNDCFLFGDF